MSFAHGGGAEPRQLPDDPVYFDLIDCFCEGGGSNGSADGGGAEPQ